MSKPVLLCDSGSGCLLRVEIVPGSRKTEFSGVNRWRGALGIRVAAPARGGLANQELVTFLAERLGVSRGSVRLVKGEKSHFKVVFLPVPAQVAKKAIGVD